MTVFGKLLEEGYTEERHLAEKLRAKYDLAYDFNIRSADGDWMSLPAHLIVLAAHGGLIPIDHIKYLWNSSLLRASHGMPCHQLTAFILEQYPDYKNLLLGPDSRNPWHVAAYWANNTAIQMMRSHIRRKYPREKEPINERATGNTPLDYATMGVRKNEIAGERSEGMALDKSLARQVRASAVECYKSLREAGALHNWELLGNTITSVSHVGLVP
ncbi:unnamed protein product [Parascedosporium putredinis]|uniref:Uncharacterized protein n=1 Tax=Parascedosporium putredinis TaxID=1442378 RepID=A0A9P1M8B7_9PEZI|nr:unnamed protein product [Parascedosporium putredinis]CAI7989810.1 unnamed protein product [Parascedosporium putredinis]